MNLCSGLFVEMIFMAPLFYYYDGEFGVQRGAVFSEVYMFACASFCLIVFIASIVVVLLSEEQLDSPLFKGVFGFMWEEVRIEHRSQRMA